MSLSFSKKVSSNIGKIKYNKRKEQNKKEKCRYHINKK